MDSLLIPISLQLNSLVVLLASFLLLGMALFIGVFQLDNRVSRFLLGLIVLNSVLAWLFVGMGEQWTTGEHLITWISLQMLQGPLLLGYVSSQVQPNFKWKKRYLLHALPMIVMLIVWQWQLTSPDSLRFVCPESSGCSQLYEMRLLHRVAIWASIMAYSIWALGLLPAYIRRIKDQFSALEGLRLIWLKWLIGGFLSLTVFAMLLDILKYWGMDSKLYGGYLQAWGPILLMLFMTGFSVRQRRINAQLGADEGVFYQASANSKESAVSTQPDILKYQSSGLDVDLIQQLWDQLDDTMKCNSLYLRQGLKLADVANELGVSGNYVSQAINGIGEQSFYDWVNQYRLEHAQRLLKESSLSVTDIAEASGFASQSSFYSHFKQRFAMTPRQYRQSRMND